MGIAMDNNMFYKMKNGKVARELKKILQAKY